MTSFPTSGGINSPIEEPSDNDPMRGEKALWRAVITQALMDAGSDSKKPEMKYDKGQAISWLSGTSRDFYIVCQLADLDPDYVRGKAREAIRNGCKWRLEAGQAKAKKAKKKAKRIETKSLEDPVTTEAEIIDFSLVAA